MHPRILIALAIVVASCGGDGPDSTPPQAAAPPERPLLAQDGALEASDPSDGRGRYDRFFVDVAANERVIVTLSSSAFDPILEITPPGSGTLVNDDYQGDRARSQIELLAAAAGAMKIEVRGYGRDALGAYRVEARRVAAGADGSVPVLAAGQRVEGELAGADQALSSGERFDSFMVRAEGAVRIAVSAIGGGDAPRTTLVGPSGLTLELASPGTYEAPDAGNYRLQVIGRQGARYRVEVASGAGGGAPILARAHHQFNAFLESLGGSRAGTPSGGTTAPGAAEPAPRAALPVRVGDRLSGSLASTDARLPSGEHYDVYELSVSAPAGEVSVQMESTSLDCFLRVEGPGGQHWENDDYGGTLSSRVDLALSAPGTYRIIATSYRPGATGGYELKLQTRRDEAVAGAPSGPEQAIAGQLRSGDRTLQTGEYFDEHRFTWAPGTRVHLEVRSDQFDPYLIVHPPSGPQRDNDDLSPGQSLNAGMDLQVNEPGEWRVIATSYRPNETGDYTLVVTGGSPSAPGPTPTVTPTPAPTTPATTPSPGERTETGTLAQGDRTLQSGEFTDVFTRTFTPRSAVQIRLDSTDFDPYLIVRTPSGTQEDNDDYQAPALNSGIDIPVAEPGTYTITVTSYRPGESGRYTLRTSEGPSIVSAPAVAPQPNGTTPPAASGGGRVWGLFAGISDYQGSANDLPECANDARKLAEAVRQQGNMPPDQEFLLTDAQATGGAIRQAMQTIAERIRPEDVLVFFYSGHGGQTDSSQDPRELDGRDEYLVAYDGNLMDDELGRLFDAIRGRVALVAIDACFAGGFAKDIITRPGRVGMFSSEEDVTSAVAGRFQAGGYLSHFLRLGIQGEADNDPSNAILTVGELTHYTWVQFGQHASDVRMSMGYQHLVVDRGAVRTTEVLWAVNR